MAVRSRRPGAAGAIDLDLRRLHAGWMERVFPSQRAGVDPVLGNWTPSTTGKRVAYHGWACLGVFVVALLYPLVVVGLALRVPAGRIDRAAARLGVGVVGASALVWGGLTAAVHVRFPDGGLAAIAGPAVLATLAAAAVAFSRPGGRVTTVLLSYPSGTTALVLPPLAAALFLGTPLDGAASLGVGSGIAVPLGWVLGCAVALADLVRPSRRERI